VTMRRRKWCEGKVRPIPGNPHDRLVSRVISSSLKESCDDPFLATAFLTYPRYWAPSMRF
jgi:hypothetical protein